MTSAPVAPPEFSPGDVALEGFRLTREHPLVIPVWAVLLFAVSLLSSWAVVTSGYMSTVTTMMQSVQKGSPPDMAAINAVSIQFLRKMAVVFPVILVFDALIRSAIARMVLTPQDKGLAYLKLGGQEALVFVARILLTLILIVFGAVCGMLVGLPLVLGPFGILIAVAVFFAAIAALIILQLRLSLTTPATFATHKVGIAQSVAMTKGRLGPLLGTYVIAIVLFLVVQFAGVVIAGVIQYAFGGAGAGQTFPTDFKSYLTVAQLLSDVVSAIFSALGVLILHSPAAVIYRRLAGMDAEKIAGTF